MVELRKKTPRHYAPCSALHNIFAQEVIYPSLLLSIYNMEI